MVVNYLRENGIYILLIIFTFLFLISIFSILGINTEKENRKKNDAKQKEGDGDGDEDALVWLARQSGGSGSFFYLAAAVGEHREFRGTNAAFVGDRIAPGALKVENGIAVAEFRDRGPGAAMASEPTIARVARYRLFSGVLQVAAQ